MERILERSLKKLRKACSSRSDKDLIEAIDTCRSKLSSDDNNNELSKSRADSIGRGVADSCFEPFRIACGKRSVKMKVGALDALEKLIAHGFLRGGEVLVPADPISRQPEITLMDRVVETICNCRNGTSSSEVHLQIIKALLTAVSSGTSKVHNRSLLATVRCCYDIYLNSRNDIIVTTTKACLTQILHAVFQQMEICAPDEEEDEKVQDEQKKETEDVETEEDGETSVAKENDSNTKGKAVVPPPVPPPPSQRPAPPRMKFPSLAHEDAYLLFQALCDMAMKSYHTDNGKGVDTFKLKRKILSLSLVSSVLSIAGDEFRRTESILRLLKDDLCRALLQNCLASQTDVVDISLKIFMKLITAFKDYLVAQIEVFINTIFLRLLDSPNTTFEHKLGVLQVFYKICQDENAVVEIFLNYDAHYTGETAVGDGSLMLGLFESIVLALEKVAQGKGQSDHKKSRTSAQDLQLRKIALASLVAILDSLVKFTHDDEDENVGNVGLYVEQTPGKRKYDEEKDNLENENGVSGSNDSKFSTPSSRGIAMTSTPSSASQLGTVLDEKRRLQKELTIAFDLFKQKPKKGLQYLSEKGMLKLEAEEVSKFLSQYSEQLDKTQIGDYIGGEKDFNVSVLHAYIDRIDLGDMEYDEAIRSFLTGFRLPGEAQKIDRIMEKFAARYLDCNPDKFANADTAFILGYAIIMLQTDLHNPNIKPEKKMTKDTFARQNRGIDDGKDLPREFLDGIYSRIKENPFTLREDDLAREEKERNEGKVSRGLFFDENRHRAKKFAKESQNIAQQSMAVLRGAIGEGDERRYCKITNNRDHIRPMFEIAWEPMLAVFSVLMERTSSENMFVVDLCLRGIRHALRIAGIEGMDEPLMSFMHCLAKYTGLSRPFELKGPKEIACIKALLATALSEGNHLCSAWKPCLACISQLSRLQLFARGGIDSIVPGSTPAKPVKSRGAFASMFSSAEQQQRELDEARRVVSEYVIEEIDMRSLDRVFVQSARLDSNAIASFVEALCGISRTELKDSRHLSGFAPADSKSTQSRRVFSLQKVVEVADFNIGCRGRMTWLKMWRELAEYFKHVGSHPMGSIAMYAIDSLKQLSMKFLEKGEMKGFNFQSSFLRPFEAIITSSPNVSIRELVLCVMQNIVLSRGTKIRSGWRSVFRVLRTAAKDNSVACVTLGFSVVEHIVRNTFGLASRHHYTDLIACVLAYTESSEVESVALRAIDLLMICCDHLASGRVGNSKGRSKNDDDGMTSRGGDDKNGDETESKIGLDSQGRVRRPHAHKQEDEDDVGENVVDMEEKLEDEEEFAVTTPKTPTESVQFQDTESDRILWWPSLTGLAELITCPYLEVRFHSMRSLFQILRRCSNEKRFSRQMWIRIFRFVLFQIFTNVRSVFHSFLSIPQK